MTRTHRMTLAALCVAGYPLIALGQHGHDGHPSPHPDAMQSDNAKGQAHARMNHPAETASENGGLSQTTCPVSGKPVDKDVVIEHDGHKVYFCCEGCPPKFKKKPEQYLPALYSQIYPQRVQVKCPVMGGDIDPEVFIEHDGQRIHFCCKGCDKDFKSDPQKYLRKLPEVSTTQVHCPVMGGLIDRALSAEVGGERVYFCCKMCEPKYKANPSKYPVEGAREAGLLAHGETAKDDLLLCPVCAEAGGGVHKRGDVELVEIDGLRYAMCGQGCADRVKQDKDKYLRILHERLVEAAGGPQKAFTCPMHPQVVRGEAGKCPLCQMNLKAAKHAK